MKVLIVIFALAVCQALAADPVAVKEAHEKADETAKMVEEVTKTKLTDKEKAAISDTYKKIATYDLKKDPKAVELMDKLKKQLPPLKQKLCKIAGRTEDKMPVISTKIGKGVASGFTKLSQEKFPKSIAIIRNLVNNATSQATPPRPDLAAAVNVQLEKAQACMAKHLTNMAVPLGKIIAKAGQKNANMFKKLITPFVDDVETCEVEGAPPASATPEEKLGGLE